MPLSACHRRPVCPVNRQQINPSQKNHTLSWCSSLCSHWWILHTPVHKPFLNFSKILKPSFYCWGKAANENRSKQWYWILARLLSPGRRFFQHFMRETRSARYEFWVYDCSAFLPRPPDPIWLTLKRGRKMLEKSSLFCRVDKGFHNIHIPSCTENTQKVWDRRQTSAAVNELTNHLATFCYAVYHGVYATICCFMPDVIIVLVSWNVNDNLQVCSSLVSNHSFYLHCYLKGRKKATILYSDISLAWGR